jgi:hypothetical protein
VSWCFSAYYLRPDQPDALQKTKETPKDAGDGWFAIRVSDSIDYGDAFNSSPDSAATLGLSRDFGEAIYVYGYSGSDEMIYEHSRGGELLRKLLWTSDGNACSWLCAAGIPEPWEDALFAPRFLENDLDVADDASVQEEIRATYAGRQIKSGSRWPSCSADAIRLVERHYGITRPAAR